MTLFRRVTLCALALGAGCGGDAAMPPSALVEASPVGEAFGAALMLPIVPLVPLTELAIPTFDGSGQAVHPDVVRFPRPWNGWEYWMAFTPYPGSNEAMENPSIAVSHDGVKWELPTGFPNPVIAQPRSGYNSDPDLTYDASADRLVMIYREVSNGQNVIKAISTGDGRAWTLPRTTFRRRNHGIVSPTVVSRAGAAPSVWYVDAGTRRCRERVTKVMYQRGPGMDALEPARPESGWEAPVRVQLQQLGFSVWHLDVIWVPTRNEYWAIYPANRSYSCFGRELFFARSPDGIKWTTYRSPVLKRSDAAWVRGSLYRGSLLYDASRDAIRIYLSASEPGSIWKVGFVEYRFADFLQALERNPGVTPTVAPLPVRRSRDDPRMEP